jgi:hypothetical protein
MSYGKHQWIVHQLSTTSDADFVGAPTYFKEAFFAGENLTPTDASNNYGGLVPLVCLYEIDWQKYHADYPSP